MAPLEDSHPATQALHADDPFNLVTDVAPPIHLSTIFRYPDDPNELSISEDPVAEFNGKNFVYSREFAPNQTRFEAILSSLLKGHAVSYATGLASLHAALTLLNPRRISIGEGYHGSHEVIAVISRLSGLQKLSLDCPTSDLNEGDVILLETPINPLGTAFSIEEYAQKAHSRGAYLIVDSTFAPPPLQDPFQWGADIIMHSGSKYFGGHSDLLCGVLATQRKDWTKQLFEDRLALGNVLGNLESWLGIRSLRTLEVRVQRASQNCAKILSWLDGALRASSPAPGSDEAVVQAVLKIYHASLQNEEWLKRQMPNGFGPVFSIVLHREESARDLPSKLRYFQHATSLGGVESLIEWRALSDPRVDRKLLRLSIGLENWEDLKNDLLQAFKALV
ncbi:Pyridoxal phosphate-dependent transferase major region subdomain 2 [Penicillium angulare]|uniref:Pyridoxal phosphate-dependent transferase major region subdomain 2 n=1 Tax=Penicillium angulare TaxID=116970 RepID=UPI0025401DDA|nr:Pyridoxal phosphate-dependent transferase major region subdomain 2 [Penicillium angulare]KAJ5291949.1 Pyridoxal phosphate-dependent transferase major region subdomain 2 [Penicillium angulare]